MSDDEEEDDEEQYVVKRAESMLDVTGVHDDEVIRRKLEEIGGIDARKCNWTL